MPGEAYRLLEVGRDSAALPEPQQFGAEVVVRNGCPGRRHRVREGVTLLRQVPTCRAVTRSPIATSVDAAMASQLAAPSGDFPEVPTP
jgi:hypothetical protein